MKRLLLLLLPLVAFAQTAFRIDPTSAFVTNGTTPPGANAPVFAVAGAIISVCTTSACSAQATTYTNAAASTPCPAYAQVTLPGSSACQSTAGNLGQFGFWLPTGNYFYTVQYGSTTYGPYPISVGGGGGSGAVSSVFGRTGAVVAAANDYTAAQVTNAVDTTSTYSNPAWLTALATSKLTGTVAPANGGFGTNTVSFTGIAKWSAGIGSVAVAGDFPTLNQNTTGNAATATAAATTPTTCASGQAPRGVTAAWAATGCQAVGPGTVTVVAGGNLTSTAFVTGGGSQTEQTPSSTATLDTAGNSIFASVCTGSCPSVVPGTGGVMGFNEGTVATTCAAVAVDCWYADSTQHGLLASFNNGTYLPLVQGPATSAANHAATFNSTTGGLLKDSGLTLTASTGTFTLTNAKTFAVTNTLTLSGTDSTVMTFPATTATIARTDAAQTFTGVQTFSSAPVIASITNTGLLTLPTSTDTLVGRATTDTLTNKTLTTPVIASISNTGTETLPSSTGGIPIVIACGSTTGTAACANTAVGATSKIYYGAATLASNAATITLTPGYTSSSTFYCVANDVTTRANPVQAVPASATTFTITNTTGASDVIQWMCIGN